MVVSQWYSMEWFGSCPCCEKPRGAQSLTGGSGAAAAEYKFALSLRCRLELKCSSQNGCQVQKAIRNKFKYVSDLAEMPAKDQDAISHWRRWMPDRDVNEFNQ